MVNTSSQYTQQPRADSSVDSNEDWIDNVCSSTTLLFSVPKKSQPAQALEAKSDHVFEGLERGLSLSTDRPRNEIKQQQQQQQQQQRKWEQPNKADKSPASSASTTPPGRVKHDKLDTDLLDSVFERIESFTCGSPTGELDLLEAAPPAEERTAAPKSNRGRTHMPQTKETTSVNGEYLTKQKDLETHGVGVRDSKSTMVKPTTAGSAMIRIVSYSNGKSMDASIQGMYLLGVTVVLAMIVTGIFLIARSV
jgi:hypothetical protein